MKTRDRFVIVIVPLLHKTRVTRNSMFEKLFRERRIEGPRKSIDSYKFKNDSVAHARQKTSF